MFKKLLLFTVLSLLTHTVLLAQTNEPHAYTLTGKLILANGHKYVYQLVFTESGGHIKGYSNVGRFLPDERRATIEGELDTIKGLLNFREIDLVFEPQDYDIHCFVTGWGRFRSERKLAWIRGDASFRPSALSKTTEPCPRSLAMLVMNPDDALNCQLTGFNPSAPKLMQRKATVKTELPEAAMEEDVQELSTANPLQLNWTGDKLNLMLMDDKEEDGDQLSVLLNGEALVREQTLTKKEYIIEAQLQPGHNILTLHAENEGTLPPNTARIILWNEQQRYVVHSVINAWREAQIEIIVPE